MESREGYQDVEIDEFTALRQELMGLEREYNSTRHELFNKMRSYYNQSIASKFIKEDDLQRLLNQCEEIKQSYFQIQNKLMSKRPNNQRWSFGDSFKFSSQISRKGKKNEKHD